MNLFFFRACELLYHSSLFLGFPPHPCGAEVGFNPLFWVGLLFFKHINLGTTFYNLLSITVLLFILSKNKLI